MRKPYAKLVSLSLLTVAIGLTGCQSNNDSNGTKGTNSSESMSNGSEAKFNVLAVRGVNSGNEYLEGFVKESQQKVGIDVNWNIMKGSDWGDKKALVLTSKDLPDAFFGGNVLTDSDIAQNSSIFLPLEDLITEHMPNLKAALDQDSKLRSIITSPDGHIYSLPKKMPGRPVVGNQLFINKEWLDRLNLKMPTTYKELEEVLTAFATQDANGNGDSNDEIPITGDVQRLMLTYGVQTSSSPVRYMDWDGKENIFYTPTTDIYKNAIISMNNLYKNKLLDQELFTQDWSQLAAKRSNEGMTLVGVADGWLPTAFGGNAKEYVPLPALEAPDGKRYAMMDQDPYGRNQFLVTVKAKNPEKLLAWIDQFYTDDASVQTYYGAFELATKKNDDGTYDILPGKDGMAQSSYSEVMAFRDEGPKYVGEDFTSKLKFQSNDGDGLKLNITKELEPYATPNYPMLSFTTEEQTRLSTLKVDIQAFVESKRAEWITKGNIEAEWDGYISQLEKMGLKEFLQIQNDALTRYKNSSK